LPNTDKASLSERSRFGKGIANFKSVAPVVSEGCQGGVLPLKSASGESRRASKNTFRSATVSSATKRRFSWLPFGKRKHSSMP
jgi:hypothetical protein